MYLSSSVPNVLTLLINNLPSGYHRDMQLTKACLFPAISELHSCLQMTHFMLQHIRVKDDILAEEKYKFLFSVEQVNELVLQGMPFREAYRMVGAAIESGEFTYQGKMQHTHEGSMGNLCNDEIRLGMQKFAVLM